MLSGAHKEAVPLIIYIFPFKAQTSPHKYILYEQTKCGIFYRLSMSSSKRLWGKMKKRGKREGKRGKRVGKRGKRAGKRGKRKEKGVRGQEKGGRGKEKGGRGKGRKKGEEGRKKEEEGSKEKEEKQRKFVFYLLGLAHTGNFQKPFRWKLLYLPLPPGREKGEMGWKNGEEIIYHIFP